MGGVPMRRVIPPLILAAGVAMLIASPVTGHTFRSDSNVYINFAGGGLYKGKVLSPRDACQKNRKVFVWHDSDPPFRIGVTHTESDGTWRLTGPAPPTGEFVFAVIPRKILRKGDGHLHVCKYDASKDVKYPTN